MDDEEETKKSLCSTPIRLQFCWIGLDSERRLSVWSSVERRDWKWLDVGLPLRWQLEELNAKPLKTVNVNWRVKKPQNQL